MVQVLRSHYVRSVDEQLLLHTAIADWPSTLHDPYTRWLSPAEVQAIERQDEGRYGGIGVHARLDNGNVLVDDVIEGSPAARAGFVDGETIVAVDGTATRGLPLSGVLTMLKGPAGTTVAVTTRSGDRAQTRSLVRAQVRARLVWPSLRRIGERAVAVVRVLEFDEGVGEQTRAAVAELLRRGATAIVLDLRADPGGLVAEAVEVASAFLPTGSAVFSEHGAHVRSHTFRTKAEPVSTTTALAVLIDRASASASEVVAGALRDGGRALIVGERSFGKGVIQDIYPLPDGSAMKATFARYRTPAGHDIDHVGLTPDVPLPDLVLHDELSGVDAAAAAMAGTTRGTWAALAVSEAMPAAPGAAATP